MSLRRGSYSKGMDPGGENRAGTRQVRMMRLASLDTGKLSNARVRACQKRGDQPSKDRTGTTAPRAITLVLG